MSKVGRKNKLLERRKAGVRRRISGTAERPRLSVRRSLKHIYAAIIDDSTGRTLCSVSSVALDLQGGNVATATTVGKAIAEKAQAVSITAVRFDRGGRLYHGRVQALADAARKAGLQF